MTTGIETEQTLKTSFDPVVIRAVEALSLKFGDRAVTEYGRANLASALQDQFQKTHDQSVASADISFESGDPIEIVDAHDANAELAFRGAEDSYQISIVRAGLSKEFDAKRAAADQRKDTELAVVEVETREKAAAVHEISLPTFAMGRAA